MTKDQVRYQNRKIEGRCTRCGHTLPTGWRKVNCKQCSIISAENTRHRRQREKNTRQIKISNITK